MKCRPVLNPHTEDSEDSDNGDESEAVEVETTGDIKRVIEGT